ncbi:class I SAM-dependent methyltransferase [Kribbella sp. NPDC003505]|uniref:class I SAM-dependent methyltransferase n=1 Tax=Kribbella sp. NPDC003505 TaxID=3154448 RepID=UPI0033AB90CB
MLDLSRNRRTLAAYEAIALEYASSTKGTPTGVNQATLKELADSLPTGGTVLELGSGPGWDADWVESLGVRVRRTDATAAFCAFQRSRGKHAERLDAITDDYTNAAWPAFDGVMALCVLLHIEREATDIVLQKVAAALRTDGVFLVSVREGIGDRWEGRASGNRYHVTLWNVLTFEERLRDAGLEPFRRAHSLDEEGAWCTFIARKTRVHPDSSDSSAA